MYYYLIAAKLMDEFFISYDRTITETTVTVIYIYEGLQNG